MEKELKIYLIEQRQQDIELIDTSLKEAGFSFQFIIPENGEKALEIFSGSNANALEELPDLIILDIQPSENKNFMSLVKALKNNEKLKTVPLIILSVSGKTELINEAYFNHVNCFVQKPEETDKFHDALKEIWIFWLETVRLPGNHRRKLKPFSAI